uniref:Pseudouridine synthase RsuA/RluA-like domain-containing protein n=1 Tax=Aureoumbra lagunensis TaxID=44058 RepID=A0A7S3NJP0_9STRA|mmetsp:Transcript_1941/g.2939  ORF Transcript_1941/g.2939 Transcript_1941/m.2939 type:complete len:438 (-) Transcript_1941:33-1346(-)|eukprot:CAMPEP_0197315570 /NCGR_PEP_ID=MMETSP0891-20130614/38828_1 /TAXON_ID=44058 ORGANISM="Aureoumbra lagunensis, Strain CCMP1510" /NCGR_SAMPLE_ID=MMETSP0891 /ASSEMBLY_ACC=CAM_ASM_000534 /LENGTH=437 /DNA_ID=CAMNT_0042804593 /DNA_START=23 /DNA_END=1336 /DNA_ORIENTATION=+
MSKQTREEPIPIYRIENGMRMVEPYVYTYRMGCKQRWLGKRVEEIFLSEFKQNPASYYREALRDGRIRVNGMADAGNHLLKDRDQILHVTHRHEPPVDGKRVVIVAEDENVLAVDKPASVPMHPCGSYHFNTLSALLRYELGRSENLKQVHRLDRLTSGLVLFAKNQKMARQLSEAIGAGKASKLYLARVIGQFPQRAPTNKKQFGEREEFGQKHKGESDAAASARMNDDTWRILFSNDLEVDIALSCLNHKDGVYACTPISQNSSAKPSKTRFRLLHYNKDDDTSILACEPKTGRTHQIRLHLQYLGHPIANDPCYGGQLNKQNQFPPYTRTNKISLSQNNQPETIIRTPGESDDALAIRCCRRCRFHVPEEDVPHAKFIWLHALRYSGPGWSYSTPLPDWASSSSTLWWHKLPPIEPTAENNKRARHAGGGCVFM